MSVTARAVRTMVSYQVSTNHLDGKGSGPFDKALAQALFACGEQVGRAGLWSSMPPDSPPREISMAREMAIVAQQNVAQPV